MRYRGLVYEGSWNNGQRVTTRVNEEYEGLLSDEPVSGHSEAKGTAKDA